MSEIKECFGYKRMWFALKGVEVDQVLSCCPSLKYAGEITWEEGLRQIRENWQSKAMLSGPYDGWIFIMGICLWDVSEVEEIVNTMSCMGNYAEEVCFFASHRVSDSYAFAKMEKGSMVRLYSCGDGELFGCVGERSAAEKELCLKLPECEEDLFGDEFSILEEEDVLDLSEKWAMRPEELIGREEARTVLLNWQQQ